MYSHFPDKPSLLVEASRRELNRLIERGPISFDDLVSTWIGSEFRRGRTLLLELHLASLRHPEVAILLAEWHHGNAERWQERGYSMPQVKLFFLLLMGLAEIDALDRVDVDAADLEVEIGNLLSAWLGADRR